MEFLHNNAAENARLQKRKNSLAGTLAKTLGFVSISFIILLLFLALNSFTVQGYARLINESGKIAVAYNVFYSLTQNPKNLETLQIK